jgi:hypothetical protein
VFACVFVCVCVCAFRHTNVAPTWHTHSCMTVAAEFVARTHTPRARIHTPAKAFQQSILSSPVVAGSLSLGSTSLNETRTRTSPDETPWNDRRSGVQGRLLAAAGGLTPILRIFLCGVGACDRACWGLCASPPLQGGGWHSAGNTFPGTLPCGSLPPRLPAASGGGERSGWCR